MSYQRMCTSHKLSQDVTNLIHLFETQLPTTFFIIFENFSKFLYSFLSPQVKQNFMSIRNIIYELADDLPNVLRLRILGNKKMVGKYQHCKGPQPYAHSPPRK